MNFIVNAPFTTVNLASYTFLQVGVRASRGYFIFMVAGYSVGLLMANMAVYVMAMGQVSECIFIIETKREIWVARPSWDYPFNQGHVLTIRQTRHISVEPVSCGNDKYRHSTRAVPTVCS